MVEGEKLSEKFKASAIPTELRAVPQWVCWKAEDRMSKGGVMKPTKVPVNSRTGANASSTARATWGTFDEALAGLNKHPGLAGVGFVFSADDNYCGVDIDKCRLDGVVDLEAAKWSKHLATYGEISHSGTGIHSILKGALPPKGRRKGRYELYDQGRFFAITGDLLPWCLPTIEHRQAQLEEFHRSIFGKVSSDRTILGPFFLNAMAEPPKDKFEALYENDTHFAGTWDHKRGGCDQWSASEWDLSLAGRAAMAEWSDQEIVDLMIAHRRKYGEAIKEHLQYYEHTLRKAREGLKSPFARIEQELGVNPAEVDTATVLDQISAKIGLPEDSRILKVEQYTGDPPLYRIYTKKGEVDVNSVCGLIDHAQLRRLLAEACGVVIRPFRGGQWDPIAQAILGALQVIDVGDEGHPLNRFAGYIEEFIESAPPMSEEWEVAAMNHHPFVKDGRIHLSRQGLMGFLMTRSGDKIKEIDAVRSLRRLGWTPSTEGAQFYVNGRQLTRRTWSRPKQNTIIGEKQHQDSES